VISLTLAKNLVEQANFLLYDLVIFDSLKTLIF